MLFAGRLRRETRALDHEPVAIAKFAEVHENSLHPDGSTRRGFDSVSARASDDRAALDRGGPHERRSEVSVACLTL